MKNIGFVVAVVVASVTVQAQSAKAQVAVQQEEIVTCPDTLAIGAFAAKLPTGWRDSTGASVGYSSHSMASDQITLVCMYGGGNLYWIMANPPPGTACTADTSTPTSRNFTCLHVSFRPPNTLVVPH
jgi:hypothetical protein